jgi:proline racemase
VFAEGQIDPPAWGPGNAGRISALYVQGRANNCERLVHHSIANTTFQAVSDEMVERSDAVLICLPRRFCPAWRISR